MSNETTDLQKALEMLKGMLYLIGKNEECIQMSMPESIEYENALQMVRDYEELQK